MASDPNWWRKPDSPADWWKQTKKAGGVPPMQARVIGRLAAWLAVIPAAVLATQEPLVAKADDLITGRDQETNDGLLAFVALMIAIIVASEFQLEAEQQARFRLEAAAADLAQQQQQQVITDRQWRDLTSPIDDRSQAQGLAYPERGSD